MTDFLVDPKIGRTTFKIDPSVQNDKVLWPSIKMIPTIQNQNVMFGTEGTLVTNKWTLKKGTIVQNTVASSDGYYQLMVKHRFLSDHGQPVPFSYSINNGPQEPLGWVFYRAIHDIGVFLYLKKGDVVAVHEPSTFYNFNMVSWSKMYFWLFRKLMDA